VETVLLRCGEAWEKPDDEDEEGKEGVGARSEAWNETRWVVRWITP
jgi:hypothetical protein